MFFLGFVLLISCSTSPKENASRVANLPYYGDATFTPHWFENGSDSLAQFHRIAPFQLTNQDGETISDNSFDNKIYIVNFFFTSCPGICPQMTDNMVDLQNELLEEEDVLLVSHSVTPERDSVPILKKYADAKGVRSGKWHLLTGDQQVIYTLGRESYFIEEDLGLEREIDDFLHTENFVLIDKNKYLRGIYNGLKKNDINQLIADIKTLKKEGF